MLGALELREKFFLALKVGAMYAAARAAQTYRMPQVQHLVINEILHGKLRYVLTVEYLADDDSVVRRVVMPERSTQRKSCATPPGSTRHRGRPRHK